MRIVIAKDYDELSKKAANLLASQITLKPNSVLGLATGSTPVGAYNELVRIYKEGDINFTEVVTFNLDEYYGLDKENPQSYYYFMMENLFKHVNMNKRNIHIPDGRAKDIELECVEYENRIKQAGGIDLQLLGIGRNGHIGFNEPDVKFEAQTHLVTLDEDTIEANSRFFTALDEVPRKAISMGIKTIMHSRKIILLASGEEKAETINSMINGKITPELPASVLQLHPDVVVLLDEKAASRL
ncbi:MAG TPA: glucosamine-6-phosphate deaminase [Patescibacteria group bacterium]|jgi:glucosamine-6-phosphate deaminase|nr:glucosamine-6-phosphate deaminase [Patescibacteria group bacterium]